MVKLLSSFNLDHSKDSRQAKRTRDQQLTDKREHLVDCAL